MVYIWSDIDAGSLPILAADFCLGLGEGYLKSQEAWNCVRESLRGVLRSVRQVADASDGAQAREAAIGLTEDWAALVVIHLIQEDDVIRIISARLATAMERKVYEHG